MDTSITPIISFPVEDPAATLNFNADSSSWIDESTYVAKYNVVDAPVAIADIDVRISDAQDLIGNSQNEFNANDNFSINMSNPLVSNLATSHTIITDADAGGTAFSVIITYSEEMDTTGLPVVSFPVEDALAKTLTIGFAIWQNTTTCIVLFDVADSSELLLDIDIQVSEAKDLAGKSQDVFTATDAFSIDMQNPMATSVVPSLNFITDDAVGTATFDLTVTYTEDMDTSNAPVITFPAEDPNNTLLLNSGMSAWMSANIYRAVYDVIDADETITDIDIEINGATDANSNPQILFDVADHFNIDTENPTVVSVTPNMAVITSADTGTAKFILSFLFDEVMDTTQKPQVVFPVENPIANTLSLNISSSLWTNANTFDAKYDVVDAEETLINIDLQVDVCEDMAGNDLVMFSAADQFSIDMQPTGLETLNPIEPLVKVYPNPAGTGTILTVELGQMGEEAIVQLFNTQGRQVHHQNVSGHQEIIRLNTAAYPAGLYLVRVVDGETETTVKVQLFR